MILTELKCANCGAPLRRDGRPGYEDAYRCEHCGALYKIEGDAYKLHVITVEHPHVISLKSVARINDEDVLRFGEEFCARQVRDQFRSGIVEQLADFIRWERRRDPFIGATMVQGTIRVVEPSFRF